MKKDQGTSNMLHNRIPELCQLFCRHFRFVFVSIGLMLSAFFIGSFIKECLLSLGYFLLVLLKSFIKHLNV